MVQCHEVDEFRRVFVVCGADAFDDSFGDILQLCLIVPQLIKNGDILLSKGSIKAVDHIISVVAALTANICCCESDNRHICRSISLAVNCNKTSHIISADVGTKLDLLLYPFRTFLGYSLLCHFIAQLDLKLRTVQPRFSIQTGNIKLAPFFLGRFLYESGRCKQESEFVDTIKLFLQFLIGIHRKAGSGNRYLAALLYTLHQFILEACADIINDFHVLLSPIIHP